MTSGRRNGKSPEPDPELEHALDATLFGLDDTELLGVVDDLADENGWTSTYAIRLQLGENPEAVRHSGIGVRLGWMKRYGWLERSPETGEWRLTAMGHAILDNPALSKSIESALGKLNPAQRLRLAREIGEAGSHGPAEVKAALRRQWQRSMGR
jgi:hypothetical protein